MEAKTVYSKYRPWDELVYLTEYGFEGSELEGLGPDVTLRLVSLDEDFRDVGAFVHGWFYEHLTAATAFAGGMTDERWPYIEAADEARANRHAARKDYGEWLERVDLGTLADELGHCLYDEIVPLIPASHEWKLDGGWLAVVPKREG